MLTQEDLEQIGKVIDGRLEPIRQNIQGLNDGQKQLESNVRGELALMKRDVQDAKNTVWMLKSDVRRLTGDMLVLKEDVQDLKRDVQGLKQDVQDLKDGQVRLEQKMDKNIEILGEFIQEISAGMDGHDTRIKQLEDHTGLSHS